MRDATSLIELLIASVILLIVIVPVGAMMTSSTGTVHRVDVQREVRTIIEHVLERAEAQDFGVLYDNFGIAPDAAGRIWHELAGELTTAVDLPEGRTVRLEITARLRPRRSLRAEVTRDPAPVR